MKCGVQARSGIVVKFNGFLCYMKRFLSFWDVDDEQKGDARENLSDGIERQTLIELSRKGSRRPTRPP